MNIVTLPSQNKLYNIQLNTSQVFKKHKMDERQTSRNSKKNVGIIVEEMSRCIQDLILVKQNSDV